MATKKDYSDELKIEKKYHKDYAKYLIAKAKWIAKQKPGEISAQDAPPPPPPPPGGDNPPKPPNP